MLHAYIDESYLAGNVHLIGALVLEPQQVDRLKIEFEQIIWKTNRAHSSVPLGIELHGQNLFQRTEEWACLRDKAKVAHAVYRTALHRIHQVGGAWFIGGVRRIERLQDRYVDPWPPHQIALQYALELVHEYAVEKGERVQIVADQVPDQAHHEARIGAFQNIGQTPGWKKASLASLEMPFQWENSRDHSGLQAADLLTYVYLRKRFVKNEHPSVVSAVQRLRDTAAPMLVKHHVWTP